MKYWCRIVTLLSIVFSFTFAQAPDTLWTKTYGGIDNDGAYSIKQTFDNGYIIAGRTSFVNPPDEEACLIKTDENGDSLWLQTYGIASAKSVVQTSDVGYVWAGIKDGAFRIVKTDSLGDTLWSRSYKGGNYYDSGEDIRQTTDGRYIAVGMTSRFTGMEYEYSIFLLRIDYNGDTLWTRTYGWRFAAWGFSVEETYDSGFIIVGYQLGDVRLIKTDNNGNPQWQRSYGGGGNQEAYSVQQTPDSGYICVGINGPTYNIYIIKTNSQGDTLWTKTYGGSGHDEGYCIRNVLSGGYIIAGYSRSYGNSSQDVYLLRIAENGDSLWACVYGGDSNDVACEVEVISDNEYIVVGYTNSYGAGGNDVWLLKLSTDPGVEERKTILMNNGYVGTAIYTGPLQLPKDKICKVFDITGRVVTPQQIKPGIYFIEVDGKIMQKVVKVR